MKLADLQQAVRAADPAAILVSSPVLHRVIQQEGRLPALLLEVPHRDSFVVDRHVLFRHVEQDAPLLCIVNDLDATYCVL